MRRTQVGAAAVVASLGLAMALPAAAAGRDPFAAQQWAIAAAGASPVAGDGDSITVAVIGGGVADHPDLPSIDHWVCVGTRGVPDRCASDRSGVAVSTATHAAGVVAARLGNGEGIVGIAPAARLVALRVVEAGVAQPDDIDAAMLHAASLGAGVVVVVLPDAAAGPVAASPSGAVQRALGAGLLVVGGAGSAAHVLDGTDSVAVDSVDRSGRPAGSAPTRARWSLAAPGGTGAGDPERAVLGTATGGDYAAMSGTWVAAAHVAGAAAVLRADGHDAESTAQRLVDAASPAPTRAAPGRLDLGAARSSGPAATAVAVGPNGARSMTPSPPSPSTTPAFVASPPPEIDAPPGVLRYPSRPAPPPSITAPQSLASTATARPHLSPLQLGGGGVLAAGAVALAALVRAARPTSVPVPR